MTEEERAYRYRDPSDLAFDADKQPSWWKEDAATWLEHCRQWILDRQKCSTGKCQGKVGFVLTYSYVTGRRGRTSWAEKEVCRDHAEKFAAKHSLDLVGIPNYSGWGW